MAFTSLGSRNPEQPELKTDYALKLLNVQVKGSSLSALESSKNRHIVWGENVRGNHLKSNKLLDVNTRRLFLCSLGVIIGTFVHDHDRAEAYENNSKQNVYPGGNNVKSLQSMGGLPKKIRSICVIMDSLQRDLMQERWDLVDAYPAQLRSYVPIFTQYTDAAFSGEEPAYKGVRVALRYEVGRFFAALERLKAATTRRDLQAAYLAYAEMALHFDRYLNVGNLYTYQDDTVSLENFYYGIDNSQLVFADPNGKDGLAEVRDLVVLIEGPDKGKTGILIGVYPPATSNNCVVKLDRYRSTSGIREIRVVPRTWAAKRLGEQDPDDVFLIPRAGGSNSTPKK